MCATCFRTYEIFYERRVKVNKNIFYSSLKKAKSRESRHRCKNRFYPYSRCVLVRRISSLMHLPTLWFLWYFTLKSNGKESRRNVYVRKEKSPWSSELASKLGFREDARPRNRRVWHRVKRKPQNRTTKSISATVFRFRP